MTSHINATDPNHLKWHDVQKFEWNAYLRNQFFPSYSRLLWQIICIQEIYEIFNSKSVITEKCFNWKLLFGQNTTYHGRFPKQKLQLYNQIICEIQVFPIAHDFLFVYHLIYLIVKHKLHTELLVQTSAGINREQQMVTQFPFTHTHTHTIYLLL